MLYFANWKILLICGVCALGVLFSLPNLFSPAQLAWLPSQIPHKQVALGLDLRGGSYLLLEVDVAAAQREQLNSIIDDARTTLGKVDSSLTVDIGADGAGKMQFSAQATDARRSQAVEQSIEIIRRRIDETGTKEPTIQRQGTDRILVQLPGVDNPEHVKTLLGKTAKLTFQLVDTTVPVDDARHGKMPA